MCQTPAANRIPANEPFLNNFLQACQEVTPVLLAAILLLILSLSINTDVSAKTLNCQKLTIDSDNRYHYTSRGQNRCEGFYIQPIKQTYLKVVSLTWGAVNFDPRHIAKISITAPGEIQRNVFIRAQPIPDRIYYRMDGVVSPGQVFSWPVKEILPQTGLTGMGVGLFGWATADNAGCWEADPKQMVLIPVKVTIDDLSDRTHQAGDDKLLLRIRVAADTRRVQWRILSAPGEASSINSRWNDSPGGKNLRAWDTFEIRLPRLNADAICVEVRAQRLNYRWTRKSLRLQITGLRR
jgi:hypothetical protein